MANIIEITDLNDPQLDAYARLTEAQLRSKSHPEKAIFIAETMKVIGHALDAGCVPVSFLMDRKHIAGAGRPLLDRCPDVPVYTADDAVLQRLTGFALTRGVLCAMKRPTLPSAEDICANAHRIAVLDGIVDSSNVGAIIRSAAALGFDAVLVTPTCCSPLYRRAVRVSMGTVFQIPWTVLDGGTERLHELGFKTVALALTDRSVGIDDPRLAEEERLALIFGTEGDGLTQSTIDSCDYTVKIPMFHGVDSLNVAAAGAVAFYALQYRK